MCDLSGLGQNLVVLLVLKRTFMVVPTGLYGSTRGRTMRGRLFYLLRNQKLYQRLHQLVSDKVIELALFRFCTPNGLRCIGIHCLH